MDEHLVLRLLPRTRALADKLAERINPQKLSVDDLHSVAALELVEAVARFGHRRQGRPTGQFEAYVSQRVRRALLAEIRADEKWEDEGGGLGPVQRLNRAPR